MTMNAHPPLTAICFRCGAGKPEPLTICNACKRRPATAEERILSVFLSTQFCTGTKLGPASRLIRAGMPVSYPPGLRPRLLAAVGESQSPAKFTKPLAVRSKVASRLPALAAIVLLILLGLLPISFSPWARYHISCWNDTEAAYDKFVSGHPGSSYSPIVREKLRKLREDAIWARALDAGEVKPLRDYLKVYPDGKFLAEARAAINQLAEFQWRAIAQDGSEEQIRAFVKNFSDTPLLSEARLRLKEVRDEAEWRELLASGDLLRLRDFAENNQSSRFHATAQAEMLRLSRDLWKQYAASESLSELQDLVFKYRYTPLANFASKRIDELYFDLAWLVRQNSLSAYRRHLELYPDSPHRPQVEKAIIDLEVATIAAGAHGTLPPSTPIRGSTSVSGYAEVNLKNDTGYELTVLYSGSESTRVVLPISGQQTVRLPPGSYRVAATVSAARVRSYAGNETLRASGYENTFYTRSSLDPIRFDLQPLPRFELQPLPEFKLPASYPSPTRRR